MNKFEKRCTSVLAGFAIVALGAIIIVVWVQFSQGAFRMPQYQVLNITNNSVMNAHEKVRIFDTNKHKGECKH